MVLHWTGAFDEFQDSSIHLESRPDRLYFRVGFDRNNRWPWIITGAQKMMHETFVIDLEEGQLTCPVDLTELDLGDGEIELKLGRIDTPTRPTYELILLPRRHNKSWPCEVRWRDLPREQPSRGGLVDRDDATGPSEDAAEKDTRGWLGPLLGIGRAHAGMSLSEIERTIRDLNNNNYRIRRDARWVIAKDFESYRDWAEYVARAEGEFQAGKTKYGRPPYRVRLGLLYALSRRHPVPREDLFAPVVLSETIIDFALDQGVSEDRNLRASAKRFAISYPGADMMRRLRALWEREQANSTERQTWARDLLAHFYYNRGVLIILAWREGLAGAIEPKAALEALAQASEWAQELPEEMQLDYAKISYGTGWSHVVGVNEGFGPDFTEPKARTAFMDTLAQVRGRSKEYSYEWQIPLIEEYLRTEDYTLFNK